MMETDNLVENLESLFTNQFGFTSTLMKVRDPAYKNVGEHIVEMVESGYEITVPDELEEYRDVLLDHVKVVQTSPRKRERERSLIRIGRCAEPIYYTLKYPNWDSETEEYGQKLKQHVDANDIRYGTFYGFGKKRS